MLSNSNNPIDGAAGTLMCIESEFGTCENGIELCFQENTPCVAFVGKNINKTFVKISSIETLRF